MAGEQYRHFRLTSGREVIVLLNRVEESYADEGEPRVISYFATPLWDKMPNSEWQQISYAGPRIFLPQHIVEEHRVYKSPHRDDLPVGWQF